MINQDRLREAIDKGLSIKDTAKYAHCSLPSVRKYRRLWGLTIKDYRKRIDTEKALELIEEGMSKRQVAKTLGCHTNALNSRLRVMEHYEPLAIDTPLMQLNRWKYNVSIGEPDREQVVIG